MKKLILSLVALLLCMTACQKEDLNLLTLEVEQFGSDAKMHIDNLDFAVWDNGDTVWLNENKRLVTVDNDNHRATIDISDIDIYSPYYASYPYYSTKVRTSFDISLPAVQTYRENGQGQQIVAAPMLAYTPDVNGILKFHNVGSVLAVKVMNDTYDPIQVHSISVTADNQKLWGDGRINMVNDSIFLSSNFITGGGNTVTLKCECGVEVPAEGKVFYIALPAITDAHLTVTVDDGYGIYTRAQTTNTATFIRNSLHQVPFSATEDVCETYAVRPNQIKYTATSKLTDYDAGTAPVDWGKTVLRHDYDASSGEGTITFNSDITVLPEYAFRRKPLVSIMLPESVETIGYQAFYECGSLTSVSIPGVMSVGWSAFERCFALTTLNLPSVTRIDDNAFWTSGIQTITFGPNLSSLGLRIFYDCSNITDIYCKAQTPPHCDEAYEGLAMSFSDMNCSPTVHVPIGKFEDYRHSLGWSSLGIIDDIPND